jgi:hypothetical protein
MIAREREHEFFAILAELDHSKTLVVKSRADLDCLLTVRGGDNRSPERFSVFLVTNRIVNEATARYLRAVKSFNNACRNEWWRFTMIDCEEQRLMDVCAAASEAYAAMVGQIKYDLSPEQYRQAREKISEARNECSHAQLALDEYRTARA